MTGSILRNRPWICQRPSLLSKRKNDVEMLANGSELQLLNTQLSFERVLKGRYLQQIGRMQRKRMMATTSDIEREHYVLPYNIQSNSRRMRKSQI